MPMCFIHGHRPRSDAEVSALIDALHAALREALSIPEDDHDIRYQEHRAAFCRVPGGKTAEYLLVVIHMFQGRSLEAKRVLYNAIVEHLSRVGVPPSEVNVLLHAAPLEDFGLRGGQAACDLDLGFKLDV